MIRMIGRNSDHVEGLTSTENILDTNMSVAIATTITEKVDVSLRECMNIYCIMKRFCQ